MRINKNRLMGVLIVLSLALASAVASAMPTVGIGLQAEFLPEAQIKDFKSKIDDHSVVFVAIPNVVSEVSLDIDSHLASAIDTAVSATNLKLASREAALVARLHEEVGWRFINL